MIFKRAKGKNCIKRKTESEGIGWERKERQREKEEKEKRKPVEATSILA